MSLRNKVTSQINKKIKKVIWKLIKPFLPFIALIIVIILLVSFLLDGIFVQAVQSDSSSLSKEELELKNMCIEEANYLNTCNNFLDNQPTNSLLDTDNKDFVKEIEWTHLYTLMLFQNLENGEPLTQESLDNLGKYFVSTFKYETSKITTEIKSVDDSGNEIWNVTNEQDECLLIESDTIYGKYTYTYKEQISYSDDGNTRLTKKVFVSENLQEEKYKRLRKYLEENISVQDDIDLYIKLVMNSSNGYYNGLEPDNGIILDKGNFIWPIPRLYTNNF